MTRPSAYCEVKCGCAKVLGSPKHCRRTITSTSKMRVVFYRAAEEDWDGDPDVQWDSAHLHVRCVTKIRVLQFFRRTPRAERITAYPCVVELAR